MSYFKFLPIVSIILICSNCNSEKESKLTQVDIEKIKKEFTYEEMNYFYEVAFYEERFNEPTDKVIKWDEDIRIYCSGNYDSLDFFFVKEAIKEINSLKIPPNLSLVKEKWEANIEIIFSQKEELGKLFNFSKNRLINGIGELYSKESGEINKAIIGINNSFEGKKSVILEEITQSLGIIGDSHSMRTSLYYQRGSSNINTLPKVDKKLIELLYHPSIPIGLSRIEYEKKFSSLIRPINANNKILQYLKKENASLEVLSMIKQTCFINDKLYKFSKDIPVYSIGQFSTKDTIFLKKSIQKINNLSQDFSIYYSGINSNKTQDGIFIDYTRTDLPLDSLSRLISTSLGKSLYTKRLNAVINLEFRDSIPVKKYPKVFNAIFDSLGPLYAKTTIADETGEVKENYAQLIDLIYNDIFPDGYALKDFEKVLIEYQNYLYKNTQNKFSEIIK